MKILVSSCLIGKRCRYDAGTNMIPGINKLFDKYSVIDICPELEGKLTCPRDKHEIVGGTGEDVLDGKARVLSVSGEDNTENFINGALKTLELAKKNNIGIALLKAKSPSCGKDKIYDGSFNSRLRKGSGVTAQLLSMNRIRIYTEDEINEIYKD